MSFLASVRRILDAIQTTQVMSKQSFTQTEYCLNFSPRAKTSLCSFSVHFRQLASILLGFFCSVVAFPRVGCIDKLRRLLLNTWRVLIKILLRIIARNDLIIYGSVAGYIGFISNHHKTCIYRFSSGFAGSSARITVANENKRRLPQWWCMSALTDTV